MDDPSGTETQAETADRLRHGSSFGAAAPAYARHRPGYAEAAVRWALEPVRARKPSAGPARQERIAAAGSGLFGAGQVGEFEHGQRRTAESLLATIATHSHLLVMDEPERWALLAEISAFLYGRPETSAGEFFLPLVTAVLRIPRE